MGRPADWRITAALAAGLCAAGPAGAVENPSADEIRAAVSRHVAAPWRVEEITIEPAAAAEGDSAILARVGARIRLTSPTFTVESREGPITFVRPVAEQGFEKRLAGSVAGVKGDGGWSLSVQFQNAEVMDSVGRPAEELPGRTVVADTEEARTLRARMDEESQRRLAEEEARRAREEQILAQQTAAARAEAERADQERRAIQARAQAIEDLRNALLGKDREDRIAAYEAALGGNDEALRQLAVEAALQSRDPVLANLALKDWLGRNASIPVLLYATKEDPTSEQVLRNLGPLTLAVQAFNPVSGSVSGTMGAPGYSITRPSAAVGTLAQTGLTMNAFGCQLSVQLTEHRTLDGLYRCQSLPTLVARIAVD